MGGTDFFNPQIADDIKGGEERWVIKEAAEKGIPPQIAVFTLIASLKELEMRNDPVPLEEIYAQMNPPALSLFAGLCDNTYERGKRSIGRKKSFDKRR